MAYTVQIGDTLSSIAGAALGDPSRWPDLVVANPWIHNPDHIEPGWTLEIPALADARGTASQVSGADGREDACYLLRFAPGWFISSRWGWRGPWPDLGVGRHLHTGWDVAGMPEDAPIPCAAPGRVLRSGFDENGYGHWVDVQHAIHVSRYAHMCRVEVTEGALVQLGDRLGGAGSTGLSTGTHLHFELRDHGSAVDPASLLRVENLR